MIQDALAGKNDMILTKLVSRFARNTVDSLVTIRKLKEKNVAVVFEKKGINTLEGTGEILITILSSLAQEEICNINENIRWGVARKFEKGKVIVNCTKFMRYTKNEGGDLVIVPEEAESVKQIFRLYLEGYRTIAEEISALKEELKTAKNEKRMADSYEQRIQDIDHYLSKSTCQIPEFDNDPVRRLISTIKVESSEKLADIVPVRYCHGTGDLI